MLLLPIQHPWLVGELLAGQTISILAQPLGGGKCSPTTLGDGGVICTYYWNRLNHFHPYCSIIGDFSELFLGLSSLPTALKNTICLSINSFLRKSSSTKSCPICLPVTQTDAFLWFTFCLSPLRSHVSPLPNSLCMLVCHWDQPRPFLHYKERAPPKTQQSHFSSIPNMRSVQDLPFLFLCDHSTIWPSGPGFKHSFSYSWFPSYRPPL